MTAEYGFCPTCGEVGVSRERRPYGDTMCARGHVHPSSEFDKIKSSADRVTIAETQGFAGMRLELRKTFTPTEKEAYHYEVIVNGESKHGKCSPDDVMRALTHYINGMTHKLEKAGLKVTQ